MRFHYGVEPEKLPDQEWCKLYAEYLFINKLNHKNLTAAIIEAATEIFNDNENGEDKYENITGIGL
ncbi:MAG: hypothetical protein P4L28_00050 [Paludibacteraceae bacterium]|nr:hypothetical protein [Paludibacteraceae bacterium]